jgi:hypothetical protein
MRARARRRRSAGEGGAYPYITRAGLRHQVRGPVLQPDGTVRRIDRRTGYHGATWTTEQDALAWLHDQQAAGRKGEFVQPGKQRFGLRS